tara:strand:+ start:4819 stop:5175 length:357 start_codon:yes stop_codon:yes gene_type:complete
MRIKLSYTVEEEDVLKEAAKLIGLSGEDLQQAVALFTSTQEELKGSGDANDIPNGEKVRQMIEEFRQALLAVDTRLSEVVDILDGYEMYRMSQRSVEEAPLESAAVPPSTFAPEVSEE